MTAPKRARLPYVAAEPPCRLAKRFGGEIAPGIQHNYRGINWPGTDQEERRRKGVSRSMQRCRCGNGRVTRYDDSEKAWEVEGYLLAAYFEGLTRC